MEYRACAIKNLTSENIDISELLSIKHIFLLEQNDNAGIQMFFDFVKWKKMFVQIVSELPTYEISIDSLECCHVVGRVASSNIDEFLEESAHRKKKFDPTLIGNKPDFSVYNMFKESNHNLLVMEVKPVKPNTNPLFSDLRKLGNEMKDIIDKCIEDGIYDDRLKIWHECDAFVMDIKHDAVYRMIHLGKFFAPRNCYDLSVISSAVELLSTIKSIVTESAQICINNLRSQNNQKIIKRKSMIRNSYTPIKYAVKKEMTMKRTLLAFYLEAIKE
ncbi:15390_t:CDS:2 [Entrophospora sp. SA101]|nr:15390_t:CDS:2 [Entrophospora sp. SA101]